MKHETEFAIEHLAQRGLPEAPLAMPVQQLEQPRRFWSLFAVFFRAALRRA